MTFTTNIRALMRSEFKMSFHRFNNDAICSNAKDVGVSQVGLMPQFPSLFLLEYIFFLILLKAFLHFRLNR